MPFEHYVGRLCEEFPGRLPSEVLAERRRLPEGFLEDLIEMRAFAAVWARLDAAEDKSKVERSPTRDLVELVMERCATADIEAKKQDA
jgi:hypothetical protein